jgi:hypothetical protein
LTPGTFLTSHGTIYQAVSEIQLEVKKVSNKGKKHEIKREIEQGNQS